MSDTGAFKHSPGEHSLEARDAGDPVSWLQIEPGWNVVTAEGNTIGAVAQVAGTKEDDIFDGLAVQQGGSLLYVPGEQVGLIYPGTVTLKITAAQATNLEAYESSPPRQQLRLPPESLATRFSRWRRR
jgi:hypothetical protein